MKTAALRSVQISCIAMLAMLSFSSCKNNKPREQHSYDALPKRGGPHGAEHQDGGGDHAAHLSAQSAESLPVRIQFYPLSSSGSVGDFWRLQKEPQLTTLGGSQDLIESQTMFTEPEKILSKSTPSRADSEFPSGTLHEVVFKINSVVFLPDHSDSLNQPYYSESDRSSNLEGEPGLRLRLSPEIADGLRGILSLKDEGFFEDLLDKTFAGPDDLIDRIERITVQRGIETSPEIALKISEYFSHHLDAMVEEATRSDMSVLPSLGVGGGENLEEKSSTVRDPYSFGPWKIRVLIDPEKNSTGPHVTVTDEKGEPLKQVLLPKGLYRGVKILWSAQAQVRGCVTEGSQAFCTRDDLAPWVKTAQLKDFIKGKSLGPTLMDLPLVNESGVWPMAAEVVDEFVFGFDHLDSSAETALNVVYSLAGLLKFHVPGKHLYDWPLGVPENRPFFYLSGHKDRTQVFKGSVGRFYEFEGKALLCPSAEDCRGQVGERGGTLHATSLQVIGDNGGHVRSLFWHGPLGTFRAQGHSASKMTSGSEMDFMSVPFEKKYDATLDPQSSEENFLSLSLKGLPELLDSWKVGQSQDLLVEGVRETSLLQKISKKSDAKKSQPQRVKWISLDLKRTL